MRTNPKCCLGRTSFFLKLREPKKSCFNEGAALAGSCSYKASKRCTKRHLWSRDPKKSCFNEGATLAGSCCSKASKRCTQRHLSSPSSSKACQGARSGSWDGAPLQFNEMLHPTTFGTRRCSKDKTPRSKQDFGGRRIQKVGGDHNLSFAVPRNPPICCTADRYLSRGGASRHSHQAASHHGKNKANS